MLVCAYCGLQAANVIEVRYARTLPLAGSGPIARDQDEAPREVLGRGYSVCDGCLALLDYHVAHHLGPQKRAFYNVLSAVYYLLIVWSLAAISSLAGTLTLLREQSFLTIGLALALFTLVVWFMRSLVHSRYAGKWQRGREGAVTPANSLGGFTDLRDRNNPELQPYLPVRFEDSITLAEKRGSPLIRAVGASGETWTDTPHSNVEGGGVNEWYRLVWVSWQLWPLTAVSRPSDWPGPTRTPVTELEVASTSLLVAGAFTLLSLSPGVPVWAAGLFSIALAPIGFSLARLLGEPRRES